MRTQVIKNFLEQHTHRDLSDLYGLSMECQVNVAQDEGERITGDYQGKKWIGWSDGIETWKSFRIPYNAKSNAEYEDKPLKFNFEKHVEAIGLTGWDWLNKQSIYFAYDFDALTGHSDLHTKKLTQEQLSDIVKAVIDIPWVTVRKSTSGKGIHFYIFIEPIPTATHTEHAAVARAILGKLSALTGFDFNSKVDICGGNMWIWHRKMAGTEGLNLVKEGDILTDIPINWKDHLKVVKYKSKKVDNDSSIESLSAKRVYVNLDDEHRKLINYLQNNASIWWWDSDNNMLVAHTNDLEKAYIDLGLKGFFKTNSSGSSTHNCFLFPLREGGWCVRRYSKGVQEHESWDQDGEGWTRCYLNRVFDFDTACRSQGGIELPKGGYRFDELEIAIQVAKMLGANIDLDVNVASRHKEKQTILKKHKDGRLMIEFQAKEGEPDNDMQGWLKEKDKWQRIFNINATPPKELDIQETDGLIRHLVVGDNSDAGWVLNVENTWIFEPLQHIKMALTSMGYNTRDSQAMVGAAVMRHWNIVNEPFCEEYPGGRKWNKDGAQLKYNILPAEVTDLSYPTWTRILKHVGKNLKYAIEDNKWCKEAGIYEGADYLKCWIASILQFPKEPLPYLFLHGPSNSGKTSFHEALELLFTKGYMRADTAMTSKADFNGELENAIICVIEEIDLGKNKTANNKMKDWVTSKSMLVHPKGCTPFLISNHTHWIHCANDARFCPIFPGDTRITVCYVEELKEEIPKRILIENLQKEAQHFVTALSRIELYQSQTRLNIPVLETSDKLVMSENNMSPLMLFIREHCSFNEGNWIKFSDFFDRFTKSLNANDMAEWTKIKLGRELPTQCPKGVDKTNQTYIGNLCWKGDEVKSNKVYILKGGKLILVEKTNE